MGAELVVIYVFAWLVRKAKRAGRRADVHVDVAVDAAVDRIGEKLHALVSGKLGQDSAYKQLEKEVAQGLEKPSELTARRVADAFAQAEQDDPQFAEAIKELGKAVLTSAVEVTKSQRVEIEDSATTSATTSGSDEVTARASVKVDESSDVVIKNSAKTTFNSGN